MANAFPALAPCRTQLLNALQQAIGSKNEAALQKL
jgi:hypothetical protein